MRKRDTFGETTGATASRALLLAAAFAPPEGTRPGRWRTRSDVLVMVLWSAAMAASSDRARSRLLARGCSGAGRCHSTSQTIGAVKML